jgi:hypothetical protein
MTENTIYVWTDRFERAYATLRERAGHWRVEWGFRDPPSSDHYVQKGEHITSVRQDAVRLMIEKIRALSDEPIDAERSEMKIRDAIQQAET